MSRVRVVIRPGFEADLRRDRGVVRAVAEVAEKGAAAARSIAPVASGAYRDSIHTDDSEGLPVRIVADDFKAGWIEFGTSDTPKFRVLGRTADALPGRHS